MLRLGQNIMINAGPQLTIRSENSQTQNKSRPKSALAQNRFLTKSKGISRYFHKPGRVQNTAPWPKLTLRTRVYTSALSRTRFLEIDPFSQNKKVADPRTQLFQTVSDKLLTFMSQYIFQSQTHAAS